jgi:hypothetical protein
MTVRLTRPPFVLTSAATERCGVAHAGPCPEFCLPAVPPCRCETCMAAEGVDMDGTRVTRDREYPGGGTDSGNRSDDNHWR